MVCRTANALPKKGTASVGGAPEYAFMLGKDANRQTLVSPTLASGEVPLPIAFQLFLPESWRADTDHLDKADVRRCGATFEASP